MAEEPKRLAPTKETLNRLFAVSGNECAFPDCKHPLFDDEFEFVAEICHIEAAMPDGERFNPLQSNEDRRDLSNLVGLCHQHHVKTDNVSKYPVAVFQQLKKDHEAYFQQPSQKFDVPTEALDNAYEKIERIYEDVQIIKKRTEDIQITVNSNTVLLESMSSMLNANFDGLERLEKEYQSQLDEITKLIDSGQVKNGIEQLTTLKNRIWFNIKDPLKFKILTNLGVYYHYLQDHENTAKLLIEAYPLNPDTEIALGNIINAYTAIQDRANALKYLDIYKHNFPDSIAAYGLEIKLKTGEQELASVEAALPDHIRELPEIVANLGMAAKKQQDLPTAQSYFIKALSLKPGDHFSGQLLLQTYLETFSADFSLVNVKVIGSEREAQIRYALELTNGLFQDIKNTDFDREKIALYIAQGYLNGLLKQIPAALSAYDEGLKIDPENVFLKKNKAVLLSMTGNKPAAAQLLLTITDYIAFPDLPAITAETLQQIGEGKKAVKILEDFLAIAQDSYYHEQSKHVLLDLNINEGDTEKVKQLISHYFQKDTIADHLSQSRAARFLGETETANEHLQKAHTLIDEHSSFKEKFFLAEELARYKFYNGAIDLYKQIAVVDSDSEPTVKLYRLYHLTGQNGEALGILKKLREKYGPTKPATNLEIDIYQMLGNYVEAEAINEAYTEKFPDHLEAALGLVGIYLRNGKIAEAAKLLDKIPFINMSEGAIKTYLAQLNAVNQRDKAYKVIYDYRREHDNEIAHQLYYQHFFQFPQNRDAREKPEFVDLDCVVTLENELAAVFHLIVEVRDQVAAKENEVHPQHKWFDKLMGKKVGDRVTLGDAKWLIKAIEDKYFFAFKESQTKCETIYNETNKLKRFKIEDFQDVIQKLSAGQSDWYRQFLQALDLYYLGSISIGALAVLFDKEPIELWLQMRAHNKGFFASSGTQRPDVLTSIKPALEGKIICADITALVTIYELKLEQIFFNRFGKIRIASSTYDVAYDFRESTRQFRSDGKGSEWAEGLILFLDKYTDSVFPQQMLSVNALEKEKADNIFGKSFADTLLVIQGTDMALLSEDFCFRSPAVELESVRGVWVQAILMILEAENLITTERYQELVVSLLNIFTAHTSIDSSILMKCYVGYEGMQENAFQKATKVLSGNRSELNSAVNVLYWFWVALLRLESVKAPKKNELIHETLLTLCDGRVINECFNHVLGFLKIRENENTSPILKKLHQSVRSEIKSIKAAMGLS